MKQKRENGSTVRELFFNEITQKRGVDYVSTSY